ncbi:phosphate ABC transporter permease subunit PstC [Oleispirillum naphthae]|uniref:phosphate ABC transporter permease subunit PstC n=1 Tax=Oleispirillum naphthae TaxID=2838853 RepID=UPI0030824616
MRTEPPLPEACADNGRTPASEHAFRLLCRAAAVTVAGFLLAVFVVLAVNAAPALAAFGPGFLTTQVWNPVTERFGAVAPIFGTLITSLIAMLVGVPLAVGSALFLTEICPHRLRTSLIVGVELLAAVPSIIYGMWGLLVFAPFLANHVQPFLIDRLGPLPLLGALFQGPPFGIGTLTAGLILGLMVLPFIASVACQVFFAIDPFLREAAYGVGATTWEVCRNVLMPQGRAGLLGASMLGLGRALGETMAVTFVIGNAHRVSASLFAPGTTISASLANEFTEAVGDLYLSSLQALGLILFVITFVVLALARLMLRHIEKGDAR